MLSLLLLEGQSTEIIGYCSEGSRNFRRKTMKWWKIGLTVGVIAIVREMSKQYGLDKEAALMALGNWSEQLGVWAIPVFVSIHTVTLALCLPYAIFFEAAASMLFGFFRGVLCVFSAKLIGASLSFWIGRSVLCFHLFLFISLFCCQILLSLFVIVFLEYWAIYKL